MRFAAGDCIPDVTLFSISMQPARSRECRNRVEQDRMEQEPDGVLRARSPGISRPCHARESNRVVLINGARDADEIENEIWKMLCVAFQIRALAPTNRGRNGEAARRDSATSPIRRFSHFLRTCLFPAQQRSEYLRRAHEQNRLGARLFDFGAARRRKAAARRGPGQSCEWHNCPVTYFSAKAP